MYKDVRSIMSSVAVHSLVEVENLLFLNFSIAVAVSLLDKVVKLLLRNALVAVAKDVVQKLSCLISIQTSVPVDVIAAVDVIELSVDVPIINSIVAVVAVVSSLGLISTAPHSK